MSEVENKIDIRELRIGSYISSDYDDEAKIIAVSKLNDGFIGGDYLDDDCSIFEASNRFKPIPITDELLGRLGFEHLLFTGSGKYIFGQFIVVDNGSFFTAHYDSKEMDIEYIHELQDLMHALTGKELTIGGSK